MEPSTSSPSPTFVVDEQGIGWITFDDPSRTLNVLTEPVMRRFSEIVEEARAAAIEGRVRVVVLRSGKPDSFLAGADVDAIEALEDPREAEAGIRYGQALFMDVETLPVPTVAAIHGVCMGGGVELALACRHRVLSDSHRTRIGLPEVQLGILPAWGGTTRLPRLVGLRPALDLLLTGRRIDARQARRIGFAGEVLPADVFQEALPEHALRCATLPPGASLPHRHLASLLLDNTAPGRRLVLAAARRKILATTGRHYPAPLRILDVLKRTLGRSVERGLAAEAQAAAALVVSPVCKNLVHVFHMREAARKGVERPGASRGEVKTLGVLGAGVMGGGIAQLAAYHGVRVRMKDVVHEAVAGGLQHARGLFDKAVERRRMSRREADHAMERISGGLDYAGFGTVQVVVEAIVEKLGVKQSVLREAEGHVPRDCVLATNTSSLSVDALAGALDHPERFCGMHFFNPVHRMPLVEIVRGARSSDDAVATIYTLALRLGKVPVVVRDGPGFLVNRILSPYLNEAGWLLADGVSIEDVDGAAKAFGMPMGPLRLIDEVGIDVSAHAGAVMHDALGARLTPAPPLTALAQSGRLGRKGALGFYRYDGRKEKGVDESVYDALGDSIPRARTPVESREIRRRLIAQMINEAAYALSDGIVPTAAEVDLALVMGTGFPPFRGGLLRFADGLHLRAVLQRIRELHERYGDRFRPAPLVEELARQDRGFYDAFRRPARTR